ncbi:hypothetical protein J2T15_004560 [Paenibacillus harenae]|uniref:Uncharacterized protein n=1 Tax=Paenibacillus harenae TaxID=306543 RepID=A0ABT9U7Y0_PAEHA|nr:hypothetical protein [Paenibacillus harenae]
MIHPRRIGLPRCKAECLCCQTADIALRTMLISEGIYLSDRLGREVTAEEAIASSQTTAVQV